MRLPWTALVFPSDFSVPDKSLPQTRQRLASSLTRVPQVGHNFVGFEGISDVISLFIYQFPMAAGIIPAFYSLSVNFLIP
jgi:hypothetical protein